MLGRHVYRVHPTEGRWTVTKEERKEKAKRGKPTVSDPGGLI